MNKQIKRIIEGLMHHHVFDWMGDEAYLKLRHYVQCGGSCSIDTPHTFCEKIQWLKIHDRKPEYTVMVDKIAAKKWCEEQLGKKYIIETLGTWDKFEDVNFGELPQKFVLKCSHDSGGLVICQNKDTLNLEMAKKKIEGCLKKNYYKWGREWPYKDVKPRILAEEYLENNDEGLHDYKVWCFNGEPQYIQYITGRIGQHTYEAFYDKNWRKQSFTYHNPILDTDVPRPERLNELIDCARTLAKSTYFMRVDFYVLKDGTLRFGEMTFYPMSGFEQWHPKEMGITFGEMIKLPCDKER